MITIRSFLAATIALLAACLVAVPTGGQGASPGSTFSATAAGTALYAGALPGGAGPAVRAGFSAAAVNSAGLAVTQMDELGA
ncbi:MAG: hypothetical protein ACRDZ3_10190, partial [Acidimicrobiia bacterium]